MVSTPFFRLGGYMSQVAIHRPSGMVARNLSKVHPSVPVPIIPYLTTLLGLGFARMAGAPTLGSAEAAATAAAVFKKSRRVTSRSFSITKTPMKDDVGYRNILALAMGRLHLGW